MPPAASTTAAQRAARICARPPSAALDGLADNDYVAALRGLARYAVSRDH